MARFKYDAEFDIIVQDNGYMAINKNIIYNPDLSLEAKTLFMAIYGLPQQNNLTSKLLAELLGETDYKIKKCLKELETQGFLIRQQLNFDGKFGNVRYRVSDVPFVELAPRSRTALESQSEALIENRLTVDEKPENSLLECGSIDHLSETDPPIYTQYLSTLTSKQDTSKQDTSKQDSESRAGAYTHTHVGTQTDKPNTNKQKNILKTEKPKPNKYAAHEKKCAALISNYTDDSEIKKRLEMYLAQRVKKGLTANQWKIMLENFFHNIKGNSELACDLIDRAYTGGYQTLLVGVNTNSAKSKGPGHIPGRKREKDIKDMTPEEKAEWESQLATNEDGTPMMF